MTTPLQGGFADESNVIDGGWNQYLFQDGSCTGEGGAHFCVGTNHLLRSLQILWGRMARAHSALLVTALRGTAVCPSRTTGYALLQAARRSTSTQPL